MTARKQTWKCMLWGGAALALAIPAIGGVQPASATAAERSDKHDAYTGKLWTYLSREQAPYTSWSKAESAIEFPVGPPVDEEDVSYMNAIAASNPGNMPYGAMVVTEHIGEADTPAGISVWFRVKEGYDPKNGDWYWAHYLPGGQAVKTSADKSAFARRGFYAEVADGRLWVFEIGSDALAEFMDKGEPAKQAIVPVVGPMGMTVKSSDRDVILAYVAAKPGFFTKVVDGRVWVFEENSEDLEEFKKSGEPAKIAVRPAAGPMGATIKSVDPATIDKYLFSKPGFAVRPDDGRLWVFKEGSEDLADFDAGNEPVKLVVRPAAGPGGITLKSTEADTIDAYLVHQPGFATFVKEGRLWVFKLGSEGLEEFKASGEPGKCVVRPGAGPGGMTVKSDELETVEAYLRSAM